MTPVSIHIPLVAEARDFGDARVEQWLRKNKRTIQRVAGLALLGALLREGFNSAPFPTDPRGMLPQERAQRFVWSSIANDLDEMIAFGAIPLVRNDDPQAFIDAVRQRALHSANTRAEQVIPTVERAYSLILRWLGEWDTDFDAAQSAAGARAERDIARIKGVREAAERKGPVVAEHEKKRARAAPVRGVERKDTLFSARLVDALRAAEGSVLDLGVRVIGPARFQSYASVLSRAWHNIGGNAAQLEEHRRRGDVEVLDEKGGYGGGRGAGQRAVILEYVVHPFDLEGSR